MTEDSTHYSYTCILAKSYFSYVLKIQSSSDTSTTAKRRAFQCVQPYSPIFTLDFICFDEFRAGVGFVAIVKKLMQWRAHTQTHTPRSLALVPCIIRVRELNVCISDEFSMCTSYFVSIQKHFECVRMRTSTSERR